MADEEPPPRRTWLWALAALARRARSPRRPRYRFRAELAAQVPGVRATLDAACRTLRLPGARCRAGPS